MNKIIWKIIIAGIFITQSLFAQSDSTFKPEGKMIIQVINRAIFNNQGSKNTYGDYINRSHFGYAYQFSPDWKAAIVLDAGRPTIFGNLKVKDSSDNNLNSTYNYKQGSYYTLTLKFSYIEFDPTENIRLQAGGILQNHYITQKKFWGYRYILETFPDKYFGIPSGDLGFIGYFDINKWLSFDLALTNGEGFKRIQDNFGNIKIGGGIDVHPIKGIIARFYYDNSSSSDPIANGDEQLISGFIGYKKSKNFRIGAEYDYHKNHNHFIDNNLYGYSIYGSYILEDNLELFLRYDNLESNTLQSETNPWNYQNDGYAYIGGIHFSPVKGVSLSLSYQGWKAFDSSLQFTNNLIFAFEYKI